MSRLRCCKHVVMVCLRTCWVPTWVQLNWMLVSSDRFSWYNRRESTIELIKAGGEGGLATPPPRAAAPAAGFGRPCCIWLRLSDSKALRRGLRGVAEHPRFVPSPQKCSSGGVYAYTILYSKALIGFHGAHAISGAPSTLCLSPLLLLHLLHLQALGRCGTLPPWTL